MPRRWFRVLAAAGLLALLFHSRQIQAASKSDLARQIRFGADMAKQGNWREAIFRWQRALALDAQNPRLHNNLAVAYESLGEYDKAETEYLAALASPDAPGEVKENHEMFLKFYTRYKEGASPSEGDAIHGPQRESPGEKGEKDAKEPDAKAP